MEGPTGGWVEETPYRPRDWWRASEVAVGWPNHSVGWAPHLPPTHRRRSDGWHCRMDRWTIGWMDDTLRVLDECCRLNGERECSPRVCKKGMSASWPVGLRYGWAHLGDGLPEPNKNSSRSVAILTSLLSTGDFVEMLALGIPCIFTFEYQHIWNMV